MTASTLPLVFTNQSELAKFIQVVTEYANLDMENGEFVKKALRGELAKLSDKQRLTTLFVSGQKMAEGNLVDMRKRFQQEVDSHSASVELREQRGDKWEVIQSRRIQS